MDWESGFSRCKLVRAEWIRNKVPPCGPGKSTRHPMINHNGTDCEKECVHVCTMSHFAVV